MGLVAPQPVGRPGPGLEPMSPASAGGFLTIAPPGRSLKFYFILHIFSKESINDLFFILKKMSGT